MAGVISFLCSIKYLNVRIISKVVKIRLGLDKLYEWYLWTFNYSIKGSKKLEPKLCFTYQRLLKFKTSLHFLKNGGTTWSMYYCLWRGSTDNFKLNRNYDRIVFDRVHRSGLSMSFFLLHAFRQILIWDKIFLNSQFSYMR